MSFYLVTGGAGFIGTNIVKRLLDDGHYVRVLDNYSSGKKPERIHDRAEYAEGDIRSVEDVERALSGADGVFHLAAVPRVTYSVEFPLETNDSNINGTLNILAAARKHGIRVVFSTSSSIYGGTEESARSKRAFTEDMPKHPQSPYALQKLAGAEYCRLFSQLYGLETVSLCYFNIYGPYMDPEGAYALVIGKFLLQRSKGEPLTICGDGEFYRDYTHVGDVVEANIRAMTRDTVGKGELINIGNNKPYSVNQVAAMIGGETVHIPVRPGDVRYACADNAKAKQLLGWEPTIGLEQGIEELKRQE